MEGAYIWYRSIEVFNVAFDTLYSHFGDDFTGHMTQPTVSEH